MVSYTYDPAKDAANRAKHGVSLALGPAVIANAAHIAEDTRADYGERRFVAFGYVEERLYVVIYTPRRMGNRIISVRRANTREQKRYG